MNIDRFWMSKQLCSRSRWSLVIIKKITVMLKMEMKVSIVLRLLRQKCSIGLSLTIEKQKKNYLKLPSLLWQLLLSRPRLLPLQSRQKPKIKQEHFDFFLKRGNNNLVVKNLFICTSKCCFKKRCHWPKPRALKHEAAQCTQLKRCLLLLLGIRSAHLEYSSFQSVMLTFTEIF